MAQLEGCGDAPRPTSQRSPLPNPRPRSTRPALSGWVDSASPVRPVAAATDPAASRRGRLNAELQTTHSRAGRDAARGQRRRRSSSRRRAPAAAAAAVRALRGADQRAGGRGAGGGADASPAPAAASASTASASAASIAMEAHSYLTFKVKFCQVWGRLLKIFPPT